MPSEIVAGDCKLLLYGTGRDNGLTVIGTSNYIKFDILKNNLINGAISVDPTDSEYVQLMAKVQEAINKVDAITGTVDTTTFT